MSKHQLVQSEVAVSDFELTFAPTSKEEFEKYIKTQLASYLVETILNNNLGTITKTNNPDDALTKFNFSMIVINQEDYNRLHAAIVRNDFQIIKDGEVTPLIELL